MKKRTKGWTPNPLPNPMLCGCCMNRRWVLGRTGRVRCWACLGTYVISA